MNKKLTLSDIARLLAERSGKKRKSAEEFLREFIAVVSEGLFVDKWVKVDGVGTFKIVAVEQRESIRVNTGERFVIPAHYKYSFLPDKELRDTVNAPFSFFETTEIVRDTDFLDLEVSEEESDPEEESVEEILPDRAVTGETVRNISDAVTENAGTLPSGAEIRPSFPESAKERDAEDRMPGMPVSAELIGEPFVPDVPEETASEAHPAEKADSMTGAAPEEGTHPAENNAGMPAAQGTEEKNKRIVPAVPENDVSAHSVVAVPDTPTEGKTEGEPAIGSCSHLPLEEDKKADGFAVPAGKAMEKGTDVRIRPVTVQVPGILLPDSAALPINTGKKTEKEAEEKNGKILAADAPAAGKPSTGEINGKNKKIIVDNSSGKSDNAFYRREFFLAAVILAAFIGVSVLLYQWYVRQPVKTVSVSPAVPRPASATAGKAAVDSLPEASAGGREGIRESDSLLLPALSAGAMETPRQANAVPEPAPGAQSEYAEAVSGTEPESPAQKDTARNTPAVIGHAKIAPGDRLTLIALKYYGHKFFWVYIYEANKDVIRNPNNVPIGTVLKIPAPETYGIDANDRASIARAAALQTKILQEGK